MTFPSGQKCQSVEFLWDKSSDHALLFVELNFKVPWRSKGVSRSWKPTCHVKVCEWFSANASQQAEDIHVFHSLIVSAQDAHASTKKERRNYFPEDAKIQFALAKSCGDPVLSECFRRAAWNTVKAWRFEAKLAQIRVQASKGRVFARKKKLYHIQQLRDYEGRKIESKTQ
eukprot:6711692-Karenia_brevis.AAC.1